MTAPGGLCGSCGSSMQWTGAHDGILVRCKHCADLFEFDPGTVVAGEGREGHEAETLHGRPVRSLSLIAKDRAECISTEES